MSFRLRIFAFLSIAAVALALPAFGDAIPYPSKGSAVPPQTIMASATGPIVAFFYGFGAADTDFIKVIDTTLGIDSGWFFENQTTAVGATLTALASVNAGDILEFQLLDQSSGNLYSSNPAHSGDGVNHFYFTPYSGGFAGIPAGTFVGGEDLPLSTSDLDYNDDQFVFTNIGTTTIPEPASMALTGLGLLAAGLLLGKRATR
jgi:hypothetical protein